MQTAYAKDGHLQAVNIIAEPITTYSVVKLQNSRRRGLVSQVCAKSLSMLQIAGSRPVAQLMHLATGLLAAVPRCSHLSSSIHFLSDHRNCSDKRSYSSIASFRTGWTRQSESEHGCKVRSLWVRDVLKMWPTRRPPCARRSTSLGKFGAYRYCGTRLLISQKAPELSRQEAGSFARRNG